MTKSPKEAPVIQPLSRRDFFGLAAGGLAASGLVAGGLALAETVAGGLVVSSSLCIHPTYAATPPLSLRVADQKGGIQAIMRAAGVLDDLPYAIKWSEFPAAAPLLEAVNANAVDMGFAGDAPTTFALAAGVRARIVGALRGNARATAVVVQPDSGIKGPEDLRGKRIATGRGSIGHYLILAAAEKYGWSDGDVKLAFLLPADAQAAFRSGAVDGWSTWNSYVAAAILTDQARVVLDGRGLMSGLGFLLATEEAIGEKRPLIEDFLKRQAIARRWSHAHLDESAHILATEVGIPDAVARLALDLEFPDTVPLDQSVLHDEQHTADLYTKAGIIPTALDTAARFDLSFNGAIIP